mgnify:CR=1 FL=1
MSKKTQLLLKQAFELHQKNDIKAATSLYQKILSINPEEPDALNLLGIIHFCNDEFDQAFKLHSMAIESKPGVADFHNNLGNVYLRLEQFDLAMEQFLAANQLDPSYSTAIANIGTVYQETNKLEQALEQYNKALSIDPKLTMASRNIANILWMLNRPQEAELIYKTAMQDQVEDATYFHNMGNIYRSQNKHFEAEQAFQKGLVLAPNYAELNFDLGLLQLSQENFESGWENYSWGDKTKDRPRTFLSLPTPIWDGSPLSDKTILIYGEQGIGDEVMFAQFIPEIANKAKGCIIACERRLSELYSRSFTKIEVISGYNASSLTKIIEQQSIDFASPIGELAKFLRPTTESFPIPKPYLIPNTKNIKKWKQHYQSLGNGLKIGISWKGGLQTLTNTTRSIDIEKWITLLKQANCHFINLQYNDPTEEIKLLKQHNITLNDSDDSLPLIDIDDFSAQIAALDLVISVDNSTVHIAGAVGTPTWLLTPYTADWRWGIDRQSSLWYSCITLFHQRISDNWSPVFVEIIDRLTTIQANKSCLPYLSYDQLPSALFLNNRSDSNHWGETCINDAISQTLNRLILKVDSIFSQQFIEYKKPATTLEQFNNSTELNCFCQSNPKLSKKIQNSDYIVINGQNLLGSSDHNAYTLLSVIHIAKTIYNKPVYLINLSINTHLKFQQPVNYSIYQLVLSQLDCISTQDSLSSTLLNQLELEHSQDFNLLPLYIRNNYSITTINKGNVIVLAGIEYIAAELFDELANYISLISQNGFTIQLLIEAKTELVPDNPCIQQLQTLLKGTTNNWHFINCHDVNTWLKTLAEAKLVISSQPFYLIAANFVQTPCITLDDNLENTALTETLNIHLPIELKSANLCNRLIQNTLPILESAEIFLSPNTQLNTLDIQAEQNFALLNRQIIQNRTLKDIHTMDIESIINIAIRTLENQQYAYAIEILSIASNKHKKNATLFYLQGLSHYYDNKLEKALVFLFKSLKIDNSQEIAFEEITSILGSKNCPSIDRWLRKLYTQLNKNIQIFYTIPNLLPTLVKNLHFNDAGIDDDKTQIYTHFILPLLISSTKKNLPELALYLENIIYNNYLYQKDSQDFFAKNVCLWAKDLERMGKTIASSLPAVPEATMPETEKKNIAFFFHNESMLAHIFHITALVSNYNQSDNNDFKFKAYFLAGHDDAMREYFRKLNIEIFNLTEHFPQANHYHHFLKLRDQIAIDNTQLLIWGCLGLFMPFAFGMRIAPHQAWISVKYKGITLDSIDHYLGFHLSGSTQTVNGTKWLSFSSTINFLSSVQEHAQGKLVREQYAKHPILLGTFARESIIRDELLLKAVVEILKKNPTCGYLWTGKNQDKFIQNYFEKNGVSHQTYFIGWVNINIYATVIDIFLDAFTFMCGHTLLRTMAAEKASITFQQTHDILCSKKPHQILINMSNGLYNDKHTSFARNILKLHSSPFIAYSFDEYVEKANMLIINKTTRNECALANKKIINHFYQNPKNTAESTIKNLTIALKPIKKQ